MADKSKWVEGKVVALKQWTERLFSVQVDATLAPFQAGQFGKLALEINDEMVGRPYSFVNAPMSVHWSFISLLSKRVL